MQLSSAVNNITSLGIGLIVTASLILAGCGGGGGSTPTSSSLGGVSAVGYPIVGGAVQIKCAAGAALTTTTSNTGTWQVTLNGQTLPCAVEVSGGTINNNPNNISYHSIAISTGVVNVTPFTDLLVTNLAAQNPNIWFAGLNPAMLTALTQANVNAALANLRAALSALTPLATINPITTSFSAIPGNSLDDLLTALQLAMTNTSSTYATLLNAATTSNFAAVVAALNAALPAAYSTTPSGVPPTAGSNPGITGVSPLGSGVGTSVTIMGTNFRQGSGGILSGDAYRVSFNGATATPYIRTLTQLGVIVPAGATTGVLTVTDLITHQVYTVPGGFMVTGQPSQTFSAIPANGVFTAPVNDVAVDFVDITGAIVTVNATDIIFEITLRNLPATFTFNQVNVPLNQLEYEWAVDFDINNDSLSDYSLSLTEFKFDPTQTVGTLLNSHSMLFNTQVNVWKKNNYLTGASASITGNTIRLSVPKSSHTDLLSITPAAKVKIRTRYKSDSTTIFTDSI